LRHSSASSPFNTKEQILTVYIGFALLSAPLLTFLGISQSRFALVPFKSRSALVLGASQTSLSLADTKKMFNEQDSSTPRIINPLQEMEALAEPILTALPLLQKMLYGGEDTSDIKAIEDGIQQAISISKKVNGLLEPLEALKQQIERSTGECAELDSDLRTKTNSKHELMQELTNLQTGIADRTTETTRI
jgi:hypothetical protein